MHTFISLFCQLKRSKHNDIPVATSTPSAHILVSNTVYQYKEPGLLGETADSWAATGSIQMGLEHIIVPERQDTSPHQNT